MENKKLFEGMTPDARRFYMRVINTAVLNLHAVGHGFFDTLLCETDDPRVARRWKEALPSIIEVMIERKQRDTFDDKPGE